MFTGDEKERKRLSFVLARESDESCAQQEGSKEVGDWTCRRLMAWRREIGLEFVDIIVKSDNEPALTSLIESQSTLRAMKCGSRMIN